jgi:pimeloyl-ACP methyl ester carboxylesterase
MKNVILAGVLLLVAAGAPARPAGEAAPPTPWSSWTEIDGTRVHYLDTAPESDLPVLLVLPGFLGSTLAFQPVVELLRGDLRVVIPDLPGFGWSEAPSGGCTMDDRLAFVRAFVERLGVGSMNLAGSSMGANIAVRYAVADAERVRRLVLLSPFGLEEQRPAVSRLERLDEWLPLGTRLMCRRTLRRELAKQVRDASELVPDIVESFFRPFRTAAGRRVVVEVSRHILYGSFFDDCLPLIAQPTLVVAGSVDPCESQEVLDTLESRIPACSARRLEGCRHMIHLDAPAEVAELVSRFCTAATP